mgnify:CR=1 FL=1
MPLVIGRNTLSYTGDVSEQQVSYHNPEAILIADGVELALAPPISLSISDKCHHVRIQGNLNIDVPYPDMPRVLLKVTSAAGTQAWHTTVYDSSQYNATIDTSTSDPDPISEVQICLMSKAGQSFTLPANSKIHFAVRGCDAVLGASHPVTGPSPPSGPSNIAIAGTTDPVNSATWAYAGELLERNGSNFQAAATTPIFRREGAEGGVPTTFVLYWRGSYWSHHSYAPALPLDHSFLNQTDHVGASRGRAFWNSQTTDGFDYPTNPDTFGAGTTVTLV